MVIIIIIGKYTRWEGVVLGTFGGSISGEVWMGLGKDFYTNRDLAIGKNVRYFRWPL